MRDGGEGIRCRADGTLGLQNQGVKKNVTDAPGIWIIEAAQDL